MIALNRFTYNGFSSVDFDLIVDLAFDGDSGENNSFLNREAISSESYRGEFKRTYTYKYTDTFNPTFTLIKNDFSEFTIEENRRVLSWLTSSYTPKFLTAYYDDSEVVSFAILGAPVDVSIYKNGNGHTIGIVFTFDSSSPYAFSDIKTITKTITSPQTFTITCDSDELDAFVYPKITVVHNGKIVQASHEMTNKAEHIDGTVYKYDYVLANTYEANTTYYIKNTSGNMVQANPQPTQNTFDLNDYYKNETRYYWIEEDYEQASSYVAGTTYYINNNGTMTLPDTQPTTSNFNQNTYYVFRKDVLHNLSSDSSNIDTTSIFIKNVTLDVESKVGNDLTNEIVILDGANRVVSTNRSVSRIFGNDFNWQWIPLAPGDNEINIVGNCSVTIEWREPRKIGEF